MLDKVARGEDQPAARGATSTLPMPSSSQSMPTAYQTAVRTNPGPTSGRNASTVAVAGGRIASSQPPSSASTATVLPVLPETPKILIFYLKFLNAKAEKNSLTIRLMDGNLDPARMYSIAFQQKVNGNLTVSVFTTEDQGFENSSSNLFFKEDLPPLKADRLTGFWIRAERRSVELGTLLNLTTLQSRPVLKWTDVQRSVDVHYVGFTGGGEGVYVKYACNFSNIGGQGLPPPPTPQAKPTSQPTSGFQTTGLVEPNLLKSADKEEKNSTVPGHVTSAGNRTNIKQGQAIEAVQQGKATSARQQEQAIAAVQQGKAASSVQQGLAIAAVQFGQATSAVQQKKAAAAVNQAKDATAVQQGRALAAVQQAQSASAVQLEQAASAALQGKTSSAVQQRQSLSNSIQQGQAASSAVLKEQFASNISAVAGTFSLQQGQASLSGQQRQALPVGQDVKASESALSGNPPPHGVLANLKGPFIATATVPIPSSTAAAPRNETTPAVQGLRPPVTLLELGSSTDDPKLAAPVNESSLTLPKDAHPPSVTIPGLPQLTYNTADPVLANKQAKITLELPPSTLTASVHSSAPSPLFLSGAPSGVRGAVTPPGDPTMPRQAVSGRYITTHPLLSPVTRGSTFSPSGPPGTPLLPTMKRPASPGTPPGFLTTEAGFSAKLISLGHNGSIQEQIGGQATPGVLANQIAFPVPPTGLATKPQGLEGALPTSRSSLTLPSPPAIWPPALPASWPKTMPVTPSSGALSAGSNHSTVPGNPMGLRVNTSGTRNLEKVKDEARATGNAGTQAEVAQSSTGNAGTQAGVAPGSTGNTGTQAEVAPSSTVASASTTSTREGQTSFTTVPVVPEFPSYAEVKGTPLGRR